MTDAYHPLSVSPEEAARAAQWQQLDPDIHIPGVTQGKIGMTVMLYGPLGTLKTTWAAQWPSPLFYSIGAEGGDDALALVPHYTGLPRPPAYQITSVDMMQKKLTALVRNYERWGIKTVVLDSITFYSDMWIREAFERKSRAGKTPEMTFRDWGLLESHITKEVAQTLHRTNLNVIWIALAKEDSTTSADGSRSISDIRPHIQGATKDKLPAMCKMVIYADKKLVADTQVPGRMIAQPVYYTSPSMQSKTVRHKYGPLFPEGHLVDPEYGTWPTFRALDSRIGQFINK